jgi:hypothetical protein
MGELPRIPASRHEEWRLMVRGDRQFVVAAGRRPKAFELRGRTKLPSGVYPVVSFSRRVCVVRTASGLVSVLI